MEKLIELLNECKGNSYRFHADGNNLIYQNETDAYGNVHITVLPDYKLISRQFGFIKWLVENDKIDFENQAMQYAKEDLSKFFTEWKDKNGMSDDYAMLLMLLAISDTPIEDLLLYLK